MDPVAEQSSSTLAIRKLTVAVWALVLVLVVNVVLMIYGQLVPRIESSRRGVSPIPSSRSDFPFVDPFADFHQWPLAKQIQNASVIALTTFKRDGGQMKSVISEILKQQPGTTFNYQVGDEYAWGSRAIQENTIYGDGEVMFFTGNPATMRYSATYSHGRVMAMGDMPIKALRQIIEGQQSARAK